MSTLTSAILGVVFLGLAVAATFLMYYLWGFPFDKATRTSSAPKPLMHLHRILGYTYGALYLTMMTQMVPRMCHYQVERPPRTVAHLVLGFLIGLILVIKIAIMRFFRHFEEWMPYPGTLLYTEGQAQSLVQRMRENGMKANAAEVRAIRAYLTTTYVKPH